MIEKIPKLIYIKDHDKDAQFFVVYITYVFNSNLWNIYYKDMYSELTICHVYDADLNKCCDKIIKEINKMNEGLKKISTYAREKNVTVQTVYNWITNGKVKFVEIDGVKFIKD